MVKNLPAVQETWVQYLSLEDPLEEGMATDSSSVAGESPWTEEPGGLQSMGSQRVKPKFVSKSICSFSLISYDFFISELLRNRNILIV